MGVTREILMISGDLKVTDLRDWVAPGLRLCALTAPPLYVITEALLRPASEPEGESEDIRRVVSSSVQFTCKSRQKELHCQAYQHQASSDSKEHIHTDNRPVGGLLPCCAHYRICDN